MFAALGKSCQADLSEKLTLIRRASTFEEEDGKRSWKTTEGLLCLLLSQMTLHPLNHPREFVCSSTGQAVVCMGTDVGTFTLQTLRVEEQVVKKCHRILFTMREAI